MKTILIKNIQLIDGTGQLAYKADVLVKGDKISAIGHFTNYQAEEIIDGMNAYLAPGFIDISNAGDKYFDIFYNQKQANLLTQGVTTIIGGHNGLSLAPLFYGTLNALKPYSLGRKVNVNWHEFSEFAAAFSKRKLGVNFGSFIGCETIYYDIIKEKLLRKLEPNEEKILYKTIEKGLVQGALGASFNLEDAYSAISYFELKKIAEMMKKKNKVCSVGFDKNGGGIIDKVKKIIHIGKETSSRFVINEFTPLVGQEKEFEQSLQLLNESRTACDAYFTLSPCREIVRPMRNYLPDNILMDTNINSIIEILKTKKKKILRHLAKTLKTGKMTIISAPGNEHLIGRTLREFSHLHNLKLAEAMFELMKVTGLQAEISSPDAAEEIIIQTVQNEKALIATGNNVNSSCGPFKKFLEITQKGKIIQLPEAINKITLLPAQLLNLRSRGAVRVGFFADMVIFKDNEIREVFVNGRRVIKEGKSQGILAGKFLKS